MPPGRLSPVAGQPAVHEAKRRGSSAGGAAHGSSGGSADDGWTAAKPRRGRKGHADAAAAAAAATPQHVVPAQQPPQQPAPSQPEPAADAADSGVGSSSGGSEGGDVTQRGQGQQQQGAEPPVKRTSWADLVAKHEDPLPAPKTASVNGMLPQSPPASPQAQRRHSVGSSPVAGSGGGFAGGADEDDSGWTQVGNWSITAAGSSLLLCMLPKCFVPIRLPCCPRFISCMPTSLIMLSFSHAVSSLHRCWGARAAAAGGPMAAAATCPSRRPEATACGSRCRWRPATVATLLQAAATAAAWAAPIGSVAAHPRAAAAAVQASCCTICCLTWDICTTVVVGSPELALWQNLHPKFERRGHWPIRSHPLECNKSCICDGVQATCAATWASQLRCGPARP